MRCQLLTLALLAASAVAASSSSSSSGSSISSSSGSSISSSSASSISSASSAADECAALTYAGGCWFDVTCAACLDRSGCALEAATGACVSAERVPAGAADASFFLSTNASYCDAADAQCASCLAGNGGGSSSTNSNSDATSSSRVCRGSGGCVCSSACEAIPTAAVSCGAGASGASQLILVMASGVMVTALVLMSIRSRMGLGALLLFAGVRLRKWWKALRGRRRAQQQRELQRPSVGGEHPERKTLKLEGWRRVMDQQQALGALELETCYVQMPRESSAAETETSSARHSGELDELSLSVLEVEPTLVQEPGTPRATVADRSAQSMV